MFERGLQIRLGMKIDEWISVTFVDEKDVNTKRDLEYVVACEIYQTTRVFDDMRCWF